MSTGRAIHPIELYFNSPMRMPKIQIMKK